MNSLSLCLSFFELEDDSFLFQDVVMYTADDRNIHSVDEVYSNALFFFCVSIYLLEMFNFNVKSELNLYCVLPNSGVQEKEFFVN